MLDLIYSGIISFDALPHVFGQLTPENIDRIAECTSSIFSVDSFALSCGSELSEYVAENWDVNWQDKVGTASPEFIAVINISRYVAAPAIALWAISGLRKLYHNGFTDMWAEFAIIIVLVWMLYGNDGTVVRQTTLAMRTLLNYQNTAVLEVANIGENFEAKLYEIADFTQAEQRIIDERSQCNGLVRNEDLLECLQGAERRAQKTIDEYRARHGETAWGNRLTDYFSRAIQQFTQNPTQLTLVGIVANPLVSVALEGIMASLNGVIQSLVELSWLLTAVIVPIPLALAFYPGGRGALIGWFVAFVSLGLFKINLNLSTAMVVSILYNRGPGDILADMMLLSLGVPILALGMTAGGGLAIFNGLSTAITAATVGFLNLSSGLMK